MIQGLDSPVAPGSRADLAYAWKRSGKTKALRQCYRDRTLSLNSQEVQEAVKTHLLPKLEKGSFVAFAGKELLEKESAGLQESGESGLEISPA